MPISPQTLNINNLRTIIAKSINLHTIRKLIEYSLKNIFLKGNVYTTVLEILLSEGRSVLSPTQRGAGSERVNYYKKSFLFGLEMDYSSFHCHQSSLYSFDYNKQHNVLSAMFCYLANIHFFHEALVFIRDKTLQQQTYN